MKNINFILVGILVFGLTTQAGAALNVTSNGNADQLVNSILGGGITFSNATFTGVSNAVGTFSGGFSAGLALDTGILLTSGSATNAIGPNDQSGVTTNNGLAGDANLNTLIPAYTTHDASVLEFDFESAGGNLFFNYQFGSDEYNEWVNSSYNDVFGFFLDGQNIALIPGTTTPVSINNVNGGLNSAYYLNNDGGVGTNATRYAGIQYDGLTVGLTAQALNLDAGSHHI